MSPGPVVHPIHLPPFLRYLWVFFAVRGFFETIGLAWRIRQRSIERPVLASGYRRYLAGSAVFRLLPWLAMGYGIAACGVPNVFSYFRPFAGSLYVTVYDLVLALMIAALGVWICFFRGAEFLLAHPVAPAKPRPPSVAWLRLNDKPVWLWLNAVGGLVFDVAFLALCWFHVLRLSPIV